MTYSDILSRAIISLLTPDGLLDEEKPRSHGQVVRAADCKVRGQGLNPSSIQMFFFILGKVVVRKLKLPKLKVQKKPQQRCLGALSGFNKRSHGQKVHPYIGPLVRFRHQDESLIQEDHQDFKGTPPIRSVSTTDGLSSEPRCRSCCSRW